MLNKAHVLRNSLVKENTCMHTHNVQMYMKIYSTEKWHHIIFKKINTTGDNHVKQIKSDSEI